MSPELLIEFTALLDALKKTSEDRASHNQQALDTVELDQNRMGRLTRMDALQGQQMAQEAERRRLVRIKRIEGALQRIQLGDFGFCYKCDQAIAVERLRFDPTITRCIDCSD
ncbi:MAG: TraR/DksA family transcriptional regulator [Marinicella sp.]